MKRKLLWISPPLVFLVLLAGITYRNNYIFPATTQIDLKVRAQLKSSNLGANVFKESTNSIKPFSTISAADKTELLNHLWLHQNAINGDLKPQLVIHFPLKKGQAEIYLGDNPASDSLYIANWANEYGAEGSPPITVSEENYALDRASSRYFRRWLVRHSVSYRN